VPIVGRWLAFDVVYAATVPAEFTLIWLQRLDMRVQSEVFGSVIK
jgi:hypothetical protein